ncbi:MAG TPA: cytochrome b N-terminal domain-containing protein [Syntrophales bacterium]|nr:cytochrome b N-terminal domain-containing protein [Syntrophales bacterium]
MFPRLLKWIDERWPLTPFIRLALDEEMAGGSSYAYVFGSSALILFLLQVVTGIWQLFYYVPTLEQGYNSLNYLRTEVPFGWLVHGLHYWGANAMVVLVMLHLSQVFIWGAYKRPHELQWITGVLLFFLTMAMSLTGGALPWDKRSYWLVEVASSTAGTVPFVGELSKRLMLGGGVIGQLTLSRFFILHAALASGILLTVAAIHLVALRKAGNAGPWDETKRRIKGPFWPDQVFKDGFVASLIILALVGLSVAIPPPYAGMADPLDATYVPKPEWNFLFFYQALKYFPGPWEVLATVGIPLGGFVVLVLVPFVDHSAERNPTERPLAMEAWAIVVVVFVSLTVAGAYSRPEGLETPAPAVQQAQPAPAFAPAAPLTAGAQTGKELFLTQGCTACHRIGASGGTIGPDLSGEGMKGHPPDWLISQLKDPRQHNPTSVMPSFAALGDAKIANLVEYLQSLKAETQAASKGATGAAMTAAQGQAALPAESGPRGDNGFAVTIIGSSDHGELLFGETCTACHGPQGKGGVPNPGSKDGTVPPLNPIDRDEFSPDAKTFAAIIDRFLQHGSRPEGPGPALSMLPFGETRALTQQQLADVEAYVMGLNGVDRARIYHPGIPPGVFLLIVVVTFVVAGLALAGLWSRRADQETEKTEDK